MNWVEEAKILFYINKPAHFTNYEHCEECAEHDETLLSKTIDSIGLDEIGNEGCEAPPIKRTHILVGTF